MDEKFDGLGGQIEGVKSEVARNSGAIREISTEVMKHKGEIEKISSQVKDLKKKGSSGMDEGVIERLVDRAIEKRRESDDGRMIKMSRDLEAIKKNGSSDNSAENSQYWFARRGVRCWPIIGDTHDELLSAVGSFFGEKLRIPQSSLKEQDIVEIRKIQSRPRREGLQDEGGVKNEVLVVLAEVQQRDMVFKHASNLSAWRDGRRAMDMPGIRLQVPTHLLGKFNTFNQHSFALRSKYGPGLKRHIRFDDTEMDLIMDVKLPDQQDWYRVDYMFALEETRINKKKKTISARGRLSSLQTSQNVAREEGPRSAPPLQRNGEKRSEEQQELVRALRDGEGVFQWGKNA